MKKILKNSLLFLCLFLPAQTFAADITIVDAIPLYDTVKYPSGFTHFDYVNPKAPKGGRIVMPAYGGFDNFNPYIFKGNASGEAAGLTLETLGAFALDDPTTVYPLIAKKFELPKDKSFVGFFIDERAKFSDGTPITADDIIFSFNALVEKGAPIYKLYYSDIEKVEKINNHHIRFHFKKDTTNRELPLIISQISIFSHKDFASLSPELNFEAEDGKEHTEHRSGAYTLVREHPSTGATDRFPSKSQLRTKAKEFDKPSLTPPLGSGPYIIDKFEPGKYIIFKRRPDYWAKDLPTVKGMYNFDEVRYDYYQDTTVTLQALFSGNIDTRGEYIAKIWVTGYDNNIVKSGKVIKAEIPHSRAATLQNFAFNIRKPKFKDRRVREAIGLAFNFDWANEKLFYNQYRRLHSYFTNTGMEATGLPTGKELEILNKYKDKLDNRVFTQAPALPSNSTTEETRDNLRHAAQLLKDAGYDFKDGKMTNLKTGEPLEFEVFSNSANGSTFTRVMLPFINNLKKIGITAKFRNLEVNVFKNRLDNFDFDMAILSFPVSQTPGNEQKEYWGSKNANTKGSYNKIGIQNEIVDDLIKGLINAENKSDYEAYVKALDRVLLNEHYMIMQWYSPFDRTAYWNKFNLPQTTTPTGFQPHTWWMK